MLLLQDNPARFRPDTDFHPDGRPRLLGPDGKPIEDENGLLLPHYRTFAAVSNAYSRSYLYTWDEAVKRNTQDALAMRRDVFITEMLRERQLPTAQLEWSIKTEDEKDTAQQEVATALTKIIHRTPRLEQMLMCLLEAVWYGRYGVQIKTGLVEIDGKARRAITGYAPTNGDKIQFQWDGTPLVYIHPTARSQFEPDDVTVTERATALRLSRPDLRQRWVIHKHEIDDADYFEGEMAGGVHGVGIRSRIYWAWWLRQDVLGWLLDFLERAGQGLTVFYYEMGNPKSEEEAKKAAREYGKATAIAWPRPIGKEKQGAGIERVEVSTASRDAMQGCMDYFDGGMRRYITGQSLSSQAESTGLGSSVADLHAQTKYRIIRFDAKNLAQTLTDDLVQPLKAWNFPDARFHCWLEFAIDRPDAKDQLDAASKVYSMGIPVDADEVRGFVGLSKPKEGAEVVQKVQAPALGPDGLPDKGTGKPPVAKKDHVLRNEKETAIIDVLERKVLIERIERIERSLDLLGDMMDTPGAPDWHDPDVELKTIGYLRSLGVAEAEIRRTIDTLKKNSSPPV